MLESHLAGPGSRKRTNAGVTNLGFGEPSEHGKPSRKVLRMIVYYLRMLLFLRVDSTIPSQAE